MCRINKLIIVLLAILSVIILISGCGPTPTVTPFSKSMVWEKVAQSVGGGQADLYSGKETMIIVVNREQVSSLEKYMASLHLQEILNTDFSSYFIIAVFQGFQGAAGYSVEVKEVRQQGDSITVYTGFLTPDPKYGLQTIITSPYYVLRVKKTPDLKDGFTFILVANGKEVMRQQCSLP